MNVLNSDHPLRLAALAALAAGLGMPVANARAQRWINWDYETPGVLEMTSLASSAIRSDGVYRIAADDFEMDWDSDLRSFTFYSVEGAPSDIIGADWYIYEFDEVTGQPGALLDGDSDVPIRRTASGMINETFGVIYRNEVSLRGGLPVGRYFLAFRTVCGPGAGELPNAPLHPQWEHGVATAHWNEDVGPDGTARGPWRPLTAFHPAPQEWAFEIDWWPTSGCYANCNRDCCFDWYDFLCFQHKFAAGAPYADCDQSGVIDFFDFLCFLWEFQIGCP